MLKNRKSVVTVFALMLAAVFAVSGIAVFAANPNAMPNNNAPANDMTPYDGNGMPYNAPNNNYPSNNPSNNPTYDPNYNGNMNSSNSGMTDNGQVLGVTDTNDTTFNSVVGVIIALLIAAAIITLVVTAIWSRDIKHERNKDKSIKS